MNFFSNIKKHSQILLIVFLTVFLVSNFIAQIGATQNSPAPYIVARIIVLLLVSAIVVATIVLVALNKSDASKIFGYILLAYFFLNLITDESLGLNVTTSFKFMGGTDFGSNSGAMTTAGVFILFVAILYILVFVLYLVSILLNNKGLNKASSFILCFAAFMAYVTGIIVFYVYIQANASWYSYFAIINTYYVIPTLVVIASIYLFNKELGIN